MFEKRKIGLLVLIVAVFAALSIVGVATAQKETPPSTEHRSSLNAGLPAAKQMLLLMDTNKDGKVSKEEWMKFMEAEFDRLDTNHDGLIDVKDMEKSRIQPTPFSRTGK